MMRQTWQGARIVRSVLVGLSVVVWVSAGLAPCRAGAQAVQEPEPWWRADGRALGVGISRVADTGGSGVAAGWLGGAVWGQLEWPSRGNLALRGQLAFAVPSPGVSSGATGISLGASFSRRRLVRAAGLLSTSGETWAQWSASKRPEGLALVRGSAAAGRQAVAGTAWYASEGFDPLLTWAGSPDAARWIMEGLDARGTAGLAAAMRRQMNRETYWELTLGWQESGIPAAHVDHPRLGYSARAEVGRRGTAGVTVRALAGLRYRPALADSLVPQAGVGLSLARRNGPNGEPLSLTLEGVADLRPEPSHQAPYASVAAAASIGLSLSPRLRMALRSQFPASGSVPGGSVPPGLNADIVLHLQVGKGTAGQPLTPSLDGSPASAAPGADIIMAYLGNSGSLVGGIAWRF